MKSRTVQESAADLGDKPCIYCGHNLRGLNASDRCPECGKLAVDSLLGDNLRDAEAPWLRLLLRAMPIIAIGYGVLLLDRLLTFSDYWIDAFEYTQKPYAWLTGYAFLLVGTWMLTTAEPSDALIAKKRGLAWVLRIAVILPLIAICFPLFVYPAWKPAANIQWILERIGDPGFVIVHSLLWLHIGRVIDRTPRREVRRLLSFMTWASVPLTVLFTWSLRSLLPQTMLLPLLLLVAAHHGFAIYLLILSGKAIRRTIGDWT